MNLSVLNVVVFGIGAILIYSAVKDVHPKDVITGALNGESPQPKTPPITSPDASPNADPYIVPTVYPSV